MPMLMAMNKPLWRGLSWTAGHLICFCMKDAAHAVKLAKGAMNEQGNAPTVLSAKAARQQAATAGTGLPRILSDSSMEPGYQKVEVRQLCARATPVVVAKMLDKQNATLATVSMGAESFFSFSSKSLLMA